MGSRRFFCSAPPPAWAHRQTSLAAMPRRRSAIAGYHYAAVGSDPTTVKCSCDFLSFSLRERPLPSPKILR
jgi:hypothetical protein